MKQNGISVYLISSSDPHQSEYLADFWKIREWLSGFTGSSGILAISEEHAGLWTDSRYFLQAADELSGCEFVLHKAEKSLLLSVIDWLQVNLPDNATLGLNGQLFSVRELELIQKKLQHKGLVIKTKLHLVDPIWKDRPSLPADPIFELGTQYSGQSRQQKIMALRKEMRETGGSYYFCSTLDDIAWLLNLRGNDIAFNPVFFAYLLVGLDDIWLFVDDSKLAEPLLATLEKDKISIMPYRSVDHFLKEEFEWKGVMFHKSTINGSLTHLLPEQNIYWSENLIQSAKAEKNEVEINNIRKAMVKDGIALTRLFRWIEREIVGRAPTEYEVGEELVRQRSDQGNYFGESFPAIVGYGPNGAIVHYRPDAQKSAQLSANGTLLLDSGGQYLEGTTDITRTVALGKPSEKQREHFTLVLKGHIALASIKFPIGIKGMHLDALARAALWKEGLNYGHGTGHGVGYFLNVHEGPQGISIFPGRGDVVLKSGMITSNEPGFYLEGAYGIRIENLILCRTYKETDFGSFLEFETLSLFPIDRSMIISSLLSEEEKNWLNNYHQKVFQRISPHLDTEESHWLAQKCKLIE